MLSAKGDVNVADLRRLEYRPASSKFTQKVDFQGAKVVFFWKKA